MNLQTKKWLTNCIMIAGTIFAVTCYGQSRFDTFFCMFALSAFIMFNDADYFLQNVSQDDPIITFNDLFPENEDDE